MALAFPSVRARDLERREVQLPDAFAGRRVVVLIAFRREHQALVDSWVPSLEKLRDSDDQLSFYELPVISRRWSVLRPMIDGGMAAAIKVPEILRRTLTIYGNLSAITVPLSISDRSTITVLLLDANRVVQWRASGSFDELHATQLTATLARMRAEE